VRIIRGILRFWYDFIIGDDWKIAAAVVVALAAAVGLVAAGLPDSVAAPLAGMLIAAAFLTALAIDTR